VELVRDGKLTKLASIKNITAAAKAESVQRFWARHPSTQPDYEGLCWTTPSIRQRDAPLAHQDGNANGRRAHSDRRAVSSSPAI